MDVTFLTSQSRLVVKLIGPKNRATFRKDAKRTEEQHRCETLVPVIFPKTDFQTLTVEFYNRSKKKARETARQRALPANYLQYCDAD